VVWVIIAMFSLLKLLRTRPAVNKEE
jgi:hypothetical protein